MQLTLFLFTHWHYHRYASKSGCNLRPKGEQVALAVPLARLGESLGGVILTKQSVEKVWVDSKRAVSVRLKNNTDYRARQGMISS